MTGDRSDSLSVRQVYDRIGSHFSATRRYPWTDVTDFLDTVDGTVGLDVGCGNGRHTEALADVVDRPIGVDLSRTVLGEATDRAAAQGFDAVFVQGDATALPVADRTIDVGLYIAAIHHLRTRSDRLVSLNALARVLAADGRALVSSWCTAHDRFERETAFDTTIDWTMPDGETVPRYYHIYDHDSFVADIDASDVERLATWVSKGNCYATVGPR